MKIKKLQLENHPVLGNLELDFCGPDGLVKDTIIIAGENGVGKSQLLEILFQFTQYGIPSIPIGERRRFWIEFSNRDKYLLTNGRQIPEKVLSTIRDNDEFEIDYHYEQTTSWNQVMFSSADVHFNGSFADIVAARQVFRSIYSGAETNFFPEKIKAITASLLDEKNHESVRSNLKTSTQVTQLLVDIRTLDESDLAQWVRENPGLIPPSDRIDTRIKRFTNAFNKMFPTKRLKKVNNVDGHKVIIFEENGHEMQISDLSSGEKQIVFRGGFLLKDVQSTQGAFILIDEPELSLHPKWQMKIMNFYKSLFISDGIQSSQIFVTTHSPFVIHNERRNDDKVIVLKKDDQGIISVVDHAKFPSWTNDEFIEEAFDIAAFDHKSQIIVFVEGITDEKYFKKCMEVFKMEDELVKFAWIGHIKKGENGPSNSGSSGLNNAFTFLTANLDHMHGRFVLLYDNDSGKKEIFDKKISVTSIPKYENLHFDRGIENSLILDSSFLPESFQSRNIVKKPNNGHIETVELNKTKLCDYICDSLTEDEQKNILENVKNVVENILSNFES